MMEKDGLKGIFLIDPSSIAYTAGIWTAQTVHWKWTTVGLLLPREGEGFGTLFLVGCCGVIF